MHYFVTKKSSFRRCMVFFALFAALLVSCTRNETVVPLPKCTPTASLIAYTPKHPLIKGLDPHFRAACYRDGNSNGDQLFLQYNTILELRYDARQEGYLQHVYVTIEGLDPAVDLRNIRLYAKGIRKSMAAKFVEGQLVYLEGNLPVQTGENVFYLKAEIQPQVSLDNRVKTTCNCFIVKEMATLPHFAYLSPGKSEGAERLRIGLALRRSGEDGAQYYRIPGLETGANGELYAVYDNRYYHWGDMPADIDVGMQISFDGGQTWSPMKNIMDFADEKNPDKKGNGCGDPCVLFNPAQNRLYCAALHSRYGWGNTPQGITPEESAQFAMTFSDDFGYTWCEPYSINLDCKNPQWRIFFDGPGKGIVMRDGTIVFPAQYQDSARVPFSTIVYSKDNGQTWQCANGARGNTTEAQVVELEDGALMLNMRNDRQEGRVVYVTSDLGRTWREHSSSKTLNEPVCQASLIRARWATADKPGILLFSNPNSRPGKGRNHMTIRASLDDGKTWPLSYYLLLDDMQTQYSCMTMIDPNTVGILYEGTGLNMIFMRIPLSDIVPNVDALEP